MFNDNNFMLHENLALSTEITPDEDTRQECRNVGSRIVTF